MGSWVSGDSVSLRRDPAFSLATELREELSVDQLYADAAIICGGEEGDQVVRTHRIVLAALSPMLRTAIAESNCRESDLVVLAPEADGHSLALFLSGVSRGGLSGKESFDQDILDMFGFRHRHYPERDGDAYLHSHKNSVVWEYFQRLDKDSAQCLRCSAILTTRHGTTSSLRRHLVTAQCLAAGDVELLPNQKLDPLDESGMDADSFSTHEDQPSFDAPEEPEDTVDHENEESSNKSMVWKYFRRPNKDLAECIKCDSIFKVKNGTTSTLRRHILRNHAELGSKALVRKSMPEKKGDDKQKDRKSLPKKKKAKDEEEKKDDNVVQCFRRIDDNMLQCLSCKEELTFSNDSAKDIAMWSHLEENHADSVASGVTPVELTPLMPVPGSAKEDVQGASFGEQRSADKDSKGRWSTVWNYFRPTELPKVFACALCDKRYSMQHCNTSNIRRHLKSRHQEQFLEMLTLEPVRLPSLPKEEVDRNDVDNKFTCEECGRSFARLSGLKNHTHKPLPSAFLCTLCGKTFTKRFRRDAHERAHMGNAPHKCSYCDKRFTTRQQHQNHERVHTGERPFHCTQCGKRFAQKDKLKTHMRVHTGEMPFSCEYCSQRFRYHSTKQKHLCGGRQQDAKTLKLRPPQHRIRRK